MCVFQECLEAIFSGQHIPERVLHGAEESLRNYPSVRYQVITQQYTLYGLSSIRNKAGGLVVILFAP